MPTEIETAVQAGIADLKSTVLARVEKIEGGLADLTEIRAQLTAIETKANRPRLGAGGNEGGERNEATDAERKSLELGVRALFAGNQAQAMHHFVESKSMEAGSNPAGGYLVNPVFSSEMTQIMLDISPLAQLARTIPMTSGSEFSEVVDKDQAESSWVGETASRSETTSPTLREFSCSLNELCAYPKLTQKLIDVSSIDVVTWLQNKVAEAFGAKESDAFHNGDGVARPRGFLTYTTAATADATRTWGQIQHIATGASGAFATATTTVSPADVLKNTIGALRAQYRKGAVWMMNRTTAAVCSTFKDTVGRFLWVDSLVPDSPATLCGYPVEISEDMPDIAANSLSIAFGNFQRGYTILRRPGVKFLVDPYSAPPYVKLLSYERVGGGVNNFEAIKLVKFSTT